MGTQFYFYTIFLLYSSRAEGRSKELSDKYALSSSGKKRGKNRAIIGVPRSVYLYLAFNQLWAISFTIYVVVATVCYRTATPIVIYADAVCAVIQSIYFVVYRFRWVEECIFNFFLGYIVE